MSTVQWELTIPLKNPNAIEVFEIKFMYMLEDDIKEFFKRNNAGIPDKNLVLLANGEEKVLDSLLSFNPNDDENVYDYAEHFRGAVKLEKLPFAKDPFGNLFCLEKDKVLYWEQETDEFYLVNESFGEFIKKLS